MSVTNCDVSILQFPSETAGGGNLTLLISSLDGDQFLMGRIMAHRYAGHIFYDSAAKTPLRIKTVGLLSGHSLVMPEQVRRDGI
ncbi:hypothetical protein AB1K62_13595 [Parasphingorhabdus sp. JC815]|uniref:hypothetical protein n=1 Tax=Parasphingorhabdus sp. JC815 TaxID=3232140 RepID=UPI0034582074